MTRLSQRHQQFLLEYITDFDGTRAIKAIGTESKQPAREAHVLLSRDDIQQALSEEMRIRIDQLDVAAEDIRKADLEIAFGNITDVVSWDGNSVTVTPSCDLPPEVARTIASIEQGKYGPRVRMHAKHASLDRLLKGFELASRASSPKAEIETDQTRASAAIAWLREARLRWKVETIDELIQSLEDDLKAATAPA